MLFPARQFGHKGPLISERELKSHLEQMFPIHVVWQEYVSGFMIDHRLSCLLVYQC